MTQTINNSFPSSRRRARLLRSMRNRWRLYVFIAIPMVFLIIFSYVPMYGVIIAFKNFKLTRGIMGSPWVGFKYFQAFFSSRSYLTIITNTLLLSLGGIIIGFPFPIFLSLVLNEIGNRKYKKTVQMITYAPYFISTVVIVSMI